MTGAVDLAVLDEGELDETMLNFSITRRVAQMRQAREDRKTSVARSTRFVLHSHPRAHDFFGVYALVNEGWRAGLTVGDFTIVANRSAAPTETNVEKLIEMGVIPVCVGRTPWSKPSAETAEISVVKNIVRWLGLQDDPVWKRVTEWQHSVYSPPGPGNWERTLGMIRTLSLAHMAEPMEMYRIIEAILDSIRAELEEERAAEEELSKLVVSKQPVRHGGRVLKIGHIQSDAVLIARISRRKPVELDILIRLDSNGNVIISGGREIDFSMVVANLRREEASRRGNPEPANLMATGQANPDDVWYYKRAKPRNFEALINGGFTANFPATVLSLEQINQCVIAGLQGE